MSHDVLRARHEWTQLTLISAQWDRCSIIHFTAKETNQVTCPMSHSWHLKSRSLDPEFMFSTTVQSCWWEKHMSTNHSSLHVLCLVDLTNTHGFKHYIPTLYLAQIFSHFSFNLLTWISGRHCGQPVPAFQKSLSDFDLPAVSNDPPTESLSMSYHCLLLVLVPSLVLLSLSPASSSSSLCWCHFLEHSSLTD